VQQAPIARLPARAAARTSDGSPQKRLLRASDRSGGWRARASAALGGVDVLAIAILVVPLFVMAMVHSLWRGADDVPGHPRSPSETSVRVTPEPTIEWHGDLALEAMPFAPDAAGRTAVAVVEPPPLPWHGDLSTEDTPVVPDAAGRMALVLVEPPPPPWHGDLALEDMPVVPDAAGRTAVADTAPPPLSWHGELALEDMPVVPDAAGRTATMPVFGRADIAAIPAPICLPANPGLLSAPQHSELEIPPRHPAAFGRALAVAARAQVDDFIIYNARYVTLAYPRGDTPPLYGVCTDVVVRAYRTFGIDLQELIHTSRLGRGDPSIDHRRVEVVRRFLARHGTSSEISEFPEDFLAGDIVTYHRPLGRISQHHIAVVSDLLAPSGRPFIVHNRGWGPQLEDALFADRITGHYRFSPADAEAFVRTRPPRAPARRQSSAVSLAAGR
jgi:uncharacterized protein YijF (DUF1287 family)